MTREFCSSLLSPSLFSSSVMDIYFAPQTKMKSKWTRGGIGTIFSTRWSICVWFQNNIHDHKKKTGHKSMFYQCGKNDAGVWYLLVFGCWFENEYRVKKKDIVWSVMCCHLFFFSFRQQLNTILTFVDWKREKNARKEVVIPFVHFACCSFFFFFLFFLSQG